MTEIEIKNSIDPLLKDLSEYKNLESAEALISKLTELLGLKTEDRYLRPTEVDALIADSSKTKAKLDWSATTHWQDLAKIMVVADLEKLS